MQRNITIREIWAIFRLRIKLKDAIISKKATNKDYYIKNVIYTLIPNILNIFKIKKYKTWIFSTSADLFLYNQKLVDNVTSSYIDEIKDSLLVIRPHKTVDTRKIWTDRYIFESILLIGVMALKTFFKLTKKQISFEEEIKEKVGDLDYKSIYYRFLAEYYLFDKIIKYAGIQRIFVNCSYTYFGYIYACRKNNVEVIEIQHGLISENHSGYIYPQKESEGSLVFPHKIFVHGSVFKDILLKNSTLYKKEQIKIIGSNALALYTKNNYAEDKQINELRNKYGKIILFTGQYTVDAKSMTLIEQIQKKHHDFCFLFLTRNKEEIANYKKTFKEIIFYTGEQKFYDLIKQVDYHATVYSTTFLESLYYGVPNILFDIENYPKEEFSDILNKNYPFVLCSSKSKEIVDFVKNNKRYSCKEIEASANSYFNTSFLINLRKELNEVA